MQFSTLTHRSSTKTVLRQNISGEVHVLEGGGRYAQDFMPELNASQLRLPKRVASATHSAAMYVAKLSFSLWREHQQKKDVDKYT
jgi:hypothetical protein